MQIDKLYVIAHPIVSDSVVDAKSRNQYQSVVPSVSKNYYDSLTTIPVPLADNEATIIVPLEISTPARKKLEKELSENIQAESIRRGRGVNGTHTFLLSNDIVKEKQPFDPYANTITNALIAGGLSLSPDVQVTICGAFDALSVRNVARRTIQMLGVTSVLIDRAATLAHPPTASVSQLTDSNSRQQSSTLGYPITEIIGGRYLKMERIQKTP